MKHRRLVVASLAVLAGATFMVWPATEASMLAAKVDWPPLWARIAALLLGAATYAAALALGVAAVIHAPKQWHLAVKVCAFLALGTAMLAFAGLAVLVPFFLLHLVCVVAKACTALLSLEALNHAFSVVAMKAAYAEAYLVVPLLLSVAVALRRRTEEPSAAAPANAT